MSRRVSIMFPSMCRLEFTKESFHTMLSSTRWDEVAELVLYDIAPEFGKDDGTSLFLEKAKAVAPVQTRLVRLPPTRIVDVMAHHASSSKAEFLAKLDNDTMVPPGWLEDVLKVMESNPHSDVIGIENFLGGRAVTPPASRKWSRASWVGGIGVWRRSAFSKSVPRSTGSWYGWQKWLQSNPQLRIGWLNPGMPVFLLDRLPMEPWASLSKKYEEARWQRPWKRYDASSQNDLWSWRWP